MLAQVLTTNIEKIVLSKGGNSSDDVKVAMASQLPQTFVFSPTRFTASQKDKPAEDTSGLKQTIKRLERELIEYKTRVQQLEDENTVKDGQQDDEMLEKQEEIINQLEEQLQEERQKRVQVG